MGNSDAAGDELVEQHLQHVFADGAMRKLKGEDIFGTRQAYVGNELIDFGMMADGHGGAEAAKLCVAKVVEYICQEAQGDATSPSLRLAGRKAFTRLHQEFCKTGWTDGTTLTVCIVNLARRELTTLNVGDSEAILLQHPGGGGGVGDSSLPAPKRQLRAQKLTAEHRLDNSERECKRVMAHGAVTIGRATHPRTGLPGGPLRVFPGGLAMARCIGDKDVGDVISPVPAASTVPLAGAGGWDIIMCSDGVWDSLAHTAVLRLARMTTQARPDKTAQLIVEAAVYVTAASIPPALQPPPLPP